MRARSDKLAGLPIAAHLALLVTLAFAAAFAVVLALVIWLPPRPPDVVRGDMLLDAFARGYAETKTTGHAPGDGSLHWRIGSAPNLEENSHINHMLRPQLAARLGIDERFVRVAAQAARAEMFVYRVRSVDHRVIDERAPPPEHPPFGDMPPPRIAPFAPEPPPPERPAPPIPPEPPLFAPPPAGVILLSGFEFGAQLPDGRWLVMSQGRNWEVLGWIGRAALVSGVTLAFLSLIALFVARRMAQPIQSFARAVEAVGVDPQSAPAPERGPRELRAAARAVNAMQARLRALVADRTQTLATVAHDMRTPLMRLRLAAEDVDPAQRDRIAKEIGEVEALVSSFIAFARDDPAQEPRVRLDLTALLQSLVDDQAEAGRDISFEGGERLLITGQSLGLKRLFSNLIDNALKYGRVAHVRLVREQDEAAVEITDEGPGVPEAARETVFGPFVRLDSSVGGAGLGLPAARSIARAHGGDIVFLAAEKGARVRVTLPL
ncbi:MAG TPA: ATP-binding protein [Caulobacterales bacterium]|nr:ATP-binding protein [Caulobacterales bacterium]